MGLEKLGKEDSMFQFIQQQRSLPDFVTGEGMSKVLISQQIGEPPETPRPHRDRLIQLADRLINGAARAAPDRSLDRNAGNQSIDTEGCLGVAQNFGNTGEIAGILSIFRHSKCLLRAIIPYEAPFVHHKTLLGAIQLGLSVRLPPANYTELRDPLVRTTPGKATSIGPGFDITLY